MTAQGLTVEDAAWLAATIDARDYLAGLADRFEALLEECRQLLPGFDVDAELARMRSMLAEADDMIERKRAQCLERDGD